MGSEMCIRDRREQSSVSFVDKSVNLPFTEHAIDFLASDEDIFFATSNPLMPDGNLLEEPSESSIAIFSSSARFILTLYFFNQLY